MKLEEGASYQAYGRDNDELNLFLNDDEGIVATTEVVDSDLTIIITNNQIPQPIQVTTNDLSKHNNDWLSGSLPFRDTVGIFLIINMNRAKEFNFFIAERWPSL